MGRSNDDDILQHAQTLLWQDWKSEKGHLSKKCMGEVWVEIISKTSIMILSHYLNNRKSKILNPKVKGRYRCHREIKSVALKIFLNLTLIFTANCCHMSMTHDWQYKSAPGPLGLPSACHEEVKIKCHAW